MGKTERLRSKEDFGATLRSGSRSQRPQLVAHVRARGDDGPSRLGVMATRRVGGSVERHRASRRLREAGRMALTDRKGLDVVLVATSETLTADMATLQRAIFQILEEKVFS